MSGIKFSGDMCPRRPRPIKCRPAPWWVRAWRAAAERVGEFVSVYRMYRLHHPRTYALRIAYGITVRGLPF